MDAGMLRSRVEVLSFRPRPGGWEWVVTGMLWAKVEPTQRNTVYAKTGVGTSGAAVTMRMRPISPANALRWKGQHLAVVNLSEVDRLHLAAETAVVRTYGCTARPQTSTRRGRLNRPELEDKEPFTFPGILLERYRGYQAPEPGAVVTVELILCTPKQIEMKAGDLLDVNEGPEAGVYWIQEAHLLDLWHNEFLLVRKVDG